MKYSFFLLRFQWLILASRLSTLRHLYSDNSINIQIYSNNHNLKVFIEETILLYHTEFLFLFVSPNEGELLGVGRTHIVVRDLVVLHLHLCRKAKNTKRLTEAFSCVE